MDTIKLEKKMRIVPLICVVAMLILRQFTDNSNPIWMTVSIILGVLALASFFFKMYLEKRNGHFIGKRYYVFYFFIVISLAMLIFNLVKQ